MTTYFTFLTLCAIIKKAVAYKTQIEEMQMRIIHHPILGDMGERKKVIIKVDGVEIEAYEGEPIASALIAAGIKVFRNTRKRNEPRRIFCAVGRCTDCIMTVDGQPNVRTCITPVVEGMEIFTQKGAYNQP